MSAQLAQFRPGLRRILHPLVVHRSHYNPDDDPRVQKTAEQDERIDHLLDEIAALRAARTRPRPMHIQSHRITR